MQPPLPLFDMPVKSTAVNKKTRESNPHEFFPTDPRLASAICHMVAEFHLPPGRDTRILDVGCGQGVFGVSARQVWPSAYIVGVDIRPVERTPAYDVVRCYDFARETVIFTDFDLVVGNPPFSLIPSILPNSYRALRPGGICTFFVRQGFLGGGQTRQKTLLLTYPVQWEYSIPERQSFTGNGISDQKTDYAAAVWHKGWQPSREDSRRKRTLWWREGYEVSW